MLKRIEEIEKALEVELYTVALASALTIPDIMGKKMCKGAKNDDKYKEWFDTYVKPYFVVSHEPNIEGEPTMMVDITGEICYKLRCAYLHAGDFDLRKADLPTFRLKTHKEDEIYENITFQRTIGAQKYIAIDVKYFCEAICKAARDCELDNFQIEDHIEWW